MAAINIEYIDFKAGEAIREYRLRVGRGGDAQDVTVAIPNAAFLDGRVRYQDGPDICFLKIRRELAAGDDEELSDWSLSMTDQELEEYRIAHAPKRPARRF